MQTINDLATARSLLSRVTGNQVRDFFTYDFGREQDNSGISDLLDPAKVFDCLFGLRKHLGPGLIAFSGTRKKDFELVVAKGADQFDALRLARTIANERGLDTEQIIERLRRYDELCGIDLYSVESDTIIFLVDHPPRDPKDLEWFVRDLKDLCPEFGPFTESSIPDWRDTLEKEGQVFIWWD